MTEELTAFENEISTRFIINPIANQTLLQGLQQRLDSRTKPIGSLGRLEKIACQVGLIFQTVTPLLKLPHLVVFAADHGAAKSGISPYPQEVTVQMLSNFMAGGASINVLAKHNHLNLVVVDAGVASRLALEETPADVTFISARVASGTHNYINEPAMTIAECRQAILAGASIIDGLAKKGCNAVGFGEMGIANTGSASLLTHFLCRCPLKEAVGRGSGHNEAGVVRKLALLQKARDRLLGQNLSALKLLAEFGGFEIAMMAGAYLAAAHNRMLIMVDGVIATSGLLIAHALQPNVIDYCIFSHCSAEPAHRYQLKHFNAEALLELGLCLGEGSGSALAYPLVSNALSLLNEMAGLDEAGVSDKKIEA